VKCRILIAGIGNIFLGDDAFGVEVIKRLAASRSMPEGVDVVDFGIRGLDLTYALLEPYEAAILVDAAPRGGTPGTLYVIEPELGESAEGPISLTAELHALDPVKVLRLAHSMGSKIEKIFIIGCEPQLPEEGDDFGMEMSLPVQIAVLEAENLVESLIGSLRSSMPEEPAILATEERS
jgi:hydrogenase maturation protease